MLKTREYYKILHFLKVESVDRIYPVEEYFYTVDEETGEANIKIPVASKETVMQMFSLFSKLMGQ